MSTRIGDRWVSAEERRLAKLARKIQKRPGGGKAAKVMLNAVVRDYYEVTRRLAFQGHEAGRLSLEQVGKTGPVFCDMAFERAGPVLRAAGIESSGALHAICEGTIKAALGEALRKRLRALGDPVQEAGLIQEMLRAFKQAGAPSSTADPDEHQAKAWRYALDLLMPHIVESDRFKLSAKRVANRAAAGHDGTSWGTDPQIDARGPMTEQVLRDTMPWIAPEDRSGPPRRPDKNIEDVVSPFNRDLARVIANEEWPANERPKVENGRQVRGRVYFSEAAEDGGPVPDDVLESTGNVSAATSSARVEGLEEMERVEIILEAAKLSARERDIFTARVYRKEPVAEIAKRLSITAGRVSQIFGEAAAKMRSILPSAKE